MRFPGFTEEWEKIKVSDLLNFYSTNSLSWEMLNYEGGDFLNLHYGLIHSGLPTLIDLKKDILPFVNENALPKKYSLCKEGDVAFADASEDTNDVAKAVEFINLDGQQVISGLHTIHGRDNENKTVLGFKGYAFASSAFHNQIRRIAQGTKIYSISSKSFDEVFIGVPTKAEQIKIARLLHLIDERITTQNKIIDNLQSLIKGLNESFHDNINGDDISLDEIGSPYSGLSGKSGEDFGHGSPYITYLNVYQNIIVDEKQIDLVSVSPNEKQNTVSYGDILFTLSSETPEETGIGCVYLGQSGKYYLNSFCFGVTITHPNKVYPPYLAYLVSSAKFRKFVYPLAQGSTRFNLHKNDFMRKKFKLLPLERQKEVTLTLDALSNRLNVEHKIINLLIEQKDYLLGNLFI